MIQIIHKHRIIKLYASTKMLIGLIQDTMCLQAFVDKGSIWLFWLFGDKWAILLKSTIDTEE